MGFGGVQRGDIPVNVTLQAMQDTAKDEQIELHAEQLSSQASFRNQVEEAVNPFAARFRNVKKDERPTRGRVQKMLESGEKSQRLLPVERIKDSANQFQRRNPELKASSLVALREFIKPGDTKEEILKKLRDFYQDVSLADEALEFLLETTDGKLALKIQSCKDELNQDHAREIKAGRNIAAQSREASDKGLGTPTSLRDMYRDITGNPRDSTSLFEELSQKYAFKDLKKVVDFMLHSLGADMKSKGPSIPRGLLHRLITETRSLQAILGVYRFFRGRMALISTLFEKNDLDLPQELTFESMAKLFMSLCAERYPSSDKVLQGAVRLGIDKWIMAKIIALSQLRDAIREVAMNQIYRSLQHRDELYMAIIEALEDLEDELEELLAEEDEEDEDEDKDEDEEDKDKPKKK